MDNNPCLFSLLDGEKTVEFCCWISLPVTDTTGSSHRSFWLLIFNPDLMEPLKCNHQEGGRKNNIRNQCKSVGKEAQKCNTVLLYYTCSDMPTPDAGALYVWDVCV